VQGGANDVCHARCYADGPKSPGLLARRVLEVRSRKVALACCRVCFTHTHTHTHTSIQRGPVNRVRRSVALVRRPFLNTYGGMRWLPIGNARAFARRPPQLRPRAHARAAAAVSEMILSGGARRVATSTCMSTAERHPSDQERTNHNELQHPSRAVSRCSIEWQRKGGVRGAAEATKRLGT
jgi:hypothetical protein